MVNSQNGESEKASSTSPRSLGTSKTFQQKIRDQISELENNRQRFLYFRKSWADKAVGVQFELANQILIDLENGGCSVGPGTKIWKSVNAIIVPQNALDTPIGHGRKLHWYHDVVIENFLENIGTLQNTKKQAISSYRDNRFRMILYRSKTLEQYMKMNTTILNYWPCREIQQSRMIFLSKNIELKVQHYAMVVEVKKHGFENQLAIEAAPKLL